jgi:hypothetical protein
LQNNLSNNAYIFTFSSKCQWTLWYTKESSYPEQYIPRYEAIIQLLQSKEVDANVVCFQEFWFKDFVFNLFREKLGHRWVVLDVVLRAGIKVASDGLLLFSRWSTSDIVHHYAFCTLDMKLFN